MINTAAFESLERLMRLKKAIEYLRQWPTITEEYHWMLAHLSAAFYREKQFAEINAVQWAEDCDY